MTTFARLKPRMALVSALALAFALTACGGLAPEDNDSQRAQRQRNYDKLKNEYQAVTGVYHGNFGVQTDHGVQPLPGQLLVYVDSVFDGYDSTGAPRLEPQLFAQLEFDGVGELDDTTFRVDYNKIDGTAKFTQFATGAGSAPGSGGAGTGGGGGGATSPSAGGTVRSCPVGPSDPQLSMAGQILNGLFKGSANGSSGPLGDVQMNKVSSGNPKPIRNQADRLVKAFSKIIGTWEGPSTIPLGNGQKVQTNSRVTLTISDVAVGAGITCPQLKAQYRLVSDVGRLDDSDMAVDYREGTGELTLTAVNTNATIQNARVCPVGPQDAQLALSARIADRILNGEIRGTGGSLGPVSLKHVSNSTAVIDDQRERLLQAYSKVQGTYAGKFKSSGPSQGFAVRIDVTVVDVLVNNYLTCPKLRGQYTRPDLISDAGALVLTADFLPVESRLVLSSTTSSTTGIPGHTDLTITAQWNPRGFHGPMQWWDRNGTVQMNRCRANSVTRAGTCG